MPKKNAPPPQNNTPRHEEKSLHLHEIAVKSRKLRRKPVYEHYTIDGNGRVKPVDTFKEDD